MNHVISKQSIKHILDRLWLKLKSKYELSPKEKVNKFTLTWNDGEISIKYHVIPNKVHFPLKH